MRRLDAGLLAAPGRVPVIGLGKTVPREPGPAYRGQPRTLNAAQSASCPRSIACRRGQSADRMRGRFGTGRSAPCSSGEASCDLVQELLSRPAAAYGGTVAD